MADLTASTSGEVEADAVQGAGTSSISASVGKPPDNVLAALARIRKKQPLAQESNRPKKDGSQIPADMQDVLTGLGVHVIAQREVESNISRQIDQVAAAEETRQRQRHLTAQIKEVLAEVAKLKLRRERLSRQKALLARRAGMDGSARAELTQIKVKIAACQREERAATSRAAQLKSEQLNLGEPHLERSLANVGERLTGESASGEGNYAVGDVVAEDVTSATRSVHSESQRDSTDVLVDGEQPLTRERIRNHRLAQRQVVNQSQKAKPGRVALIKNPSSKTRPAPSHELAYAHAAKRAAADAQSSQVEAHGPSNDTGKQTLAPRPTASKAPLVPKHSSKQKQEAGIVCHTEGCINNSSPNCDGYCQSCFKYLLQGEAPLAKRRKAGLQGRLATRAAVSVETDVGVADDLVESADTVATAPPRVVDNVAEEEEDYTEEDAAFSDHENEAVAAATTEGKTVERKRPVASQDDGSVAAYHARLEAWRQHLGDLSGTDVTQLEHTSHNNFYQDNGIVFGSFNDPSVPLGGSLYCPSVLWQRLYPYQHSCLKWFATLHEQNVGGILADEMGLGKTVQMVTFLASVQYGRRGSAGVEWLATAKPSCEGQGRTASDKGAILVVCPATVIHQWVREFHRWWPPFRVAALHASGTYDGPGNLIDVIARAGTGNVLVTTYAQLRRQQLHLASQRWAYVVLDEGHKIRNPDAAVTLAVKSISTPHRIILTGSPVQNNLRELWSLFDFVFPGRLGELPAFERDLHTPIREGSYANASAAQVETAFKCSSVLKETIAPYMLCRTKDQVQSQIQLPPRDEQVLFCKLTDEQKDIYRHYVRSRAVSSMLAGEHSIFQGVDTLRKICNHPDLATNCCTVPDYTADDAPLPWQRSGKMIVLRQLLRLWKDGGHRALVFCQTRQMLNLLESFVKAEGYRFLRMDGTTSVKQRQPLIAQYNADESIFLFVLTTRVGGLGVNLTGADRVVIFDPDWNPSTDIQARERAWRIGQGRAVTIYRLLTAGTIEEKIYHRQVFKQLLSNRVLKDPKQRRFFKANDLYELFVLGDDEDEETETAALCDDVASKGAKKAKMDVAARQLRESRGLLPSDTGSEATTSVWASSKRKTREKLHPDAHSKRNMSSGTGGRKRPPGKVAKRDAGVKASGLAQIDHLATVEHTGVESRSSSAQHAASSSSDAAGEDKVLDILLQTSGMHSVVKHDRLVESTPTESMVTERHAARQAVKAGQMLKAAAKAARRRAAGALTWTGRFGGSTSTGARSTPDGVGRGLQQRSSKMRFGAKASLTSAESGAARGSNSSTLLATIRARQEGKPAQPNSGAAHSTSPLASVPASSVLPLMRDIQTYLNQRGGTATSERLIRHFSARVGASNSMLFKHALKELCHLNRAGTGAVAKWTLKAEYAGATAIDESMLES